MHCPPGDQPPLHVHEREDEGFYVLEGELTLWAGDEPPVKLVPGEYALAPHGVPHTYRAGDAGAVSSSPPPRRLRAVPARGRRARRRGPSCPVLDGPPDVERLGRIAAAHGITLLGPPGMLPTDLAAASASGPGPRRLAGSRSGTRSSRRWSGRPTTLR